MGTDADVASEAYEQILEIQSLDQSIDQLRHRSERHPSRAKLAEIDEALAASDAEVAEVDGRKHELQRQQKRLEDEVATIEGKRRDIDGKLYGGEVTASKELLALQDEAASLLGRQTQIEDDDLVVMEQIEEIDGELAALAERRAGLEADRAAADADLQAAVGEIDQEIAQISGRRDEAAGPANAELLARYDELRPQYDGHPVARLVDGRCDGCHIQLSAVAVDQMGKMPEDAVVTCEECGRLLVR